MSTTKTKLSTGAVAIVGTKEMKSAPKPKRPPKTLKERKFVKAYLESGNATQAVIKAGYDVGSNVAARAIASQNLTKLTLTDHFEEMGLTDRAIAANITRIALSARKRDQFSGEYEEDNHMQLKATEIAIKVMGKMPKEQGDTNVLLQTNGNGPVLVQFLRDGKPTTDNNSDTG